MKKLYSEILGRFPEVDLLVDSEEDSPYAYLSYVSGWIEDLAASEVSDALCDRVATFGEWCCAQPEGNDAEDDIGTILMVGLYESLGSSDNGRKVLAHIWDKSYVLASESYLRQCVGDAEYEDLLARYK